MSEADDKLALTAAFQAALAARQETFLAHLPRAVKLVVAFLLLCLLIYPMTGGSPKTEPKSHEDETQYEAEASQGQDAAHKTAGSSHGQSPAQAPAQPPSSEEQKQAMQINDQEAEGPRMAPAPDPLVTEETPSGRLPKIGPEGQRPWQVYARPFDQRDPRPRIAIVIGDLGLSRVATDSALRRLPAAVTMAFDVQGSSIDAWLDRARQDGHETLLALPMEPLDFPRNDPGPGALLTTLPNSDNIQRLQDSFKLGTGFVGVTSFSGSRFVSDAAKLAPVLEDLRNRGLLLLDARVASFGVMRDVAVKMGVPTAVSLRAVDSTPTPQAIDAALSQLEQTARVDGKVIATASPLPITLDRLENWMKTLPSKGFVLAPVSAVVE